MRGSALILQNNLSATKYAGMMIWHTVNRRLEIVNGWILGKASHLGLVSLKIYNPALV